MLQPSTPVSNLYLSYSNPFSLNNTTTSTCLKHSFPVPRPDFYRKRESTAITVALWTCYDVQHHGPEVSFFPPHCLCCHTPSCCKCGRHYVHHVTRRRKRRRSTRACHKPNNLICLHRSCPDMVVFHFPRFNAHCLFCIILQLNATINARSDRTAIRNCPT